MEYNKINNLEGSQSEKLSKFVTREYVKVNSLSNTYNENKSIRFKTPMLRSDLCDYADAYILINSTITDTANAGANNIRDKTNRPLILKNNAPFVSCITRINNELIEDAEDLDIVMPMYNLLKVSKNYKKTIGSVYNYYRDELTNDINNNFANRNVVTSNAFRYKNKTTGNTYNIAAATAGYDSNKEGTQAIELAIPLKYLGNFWKPLNMPLISCEASLELKWDKNCVITSLEQRQVDDGPPVVRDNAPTGATLNINDCKLYIPVVTLSKDEEIKLLTNLKSGFKREIKWNKYRSQVSREEINNNLNILIDPTFSNLLDYDYFKNYYKLIAIDLSKQQVLQENKDLIQQINFIGRLEQISNIFIIIEKKEETILEFSQNFANVLYK